MMRSKKQLFSILLCMIAGIDAAEPNYYELLGILRVSRPDEIRRACQGKEMEIKNKLEPQFTKAKLEKDKAQQLLDRAKTVKLSKNQSMDAVSELAQRLGVDISNQPKTLDQFLSVYELNVRILQQNVDEIQKKIATIGKACSTLQDLQRKAAYDRTLPMETMSLVGPPPTEERCLMLEKQALNELGPKIAGMNPIEKERVLKEMMVGCPIPYPLPQTESQWRTSYQAKYQKFINEKKAGKPDDVSGIRSRIQAARAANLDVKLSGMLTAALAQIEIPDVGGNILGQDLLMKNLSFLEAPMGLDVRQGVGFTGTVQINNFDVKCTVFVIENYQNKAGYSVSIELPSTFKMSDLIPDFKQLDALTLPKAKIVISTFRYMDPDGFNIKAGFNFGSYLDLSGPLQLLGDLMHKAKELKSIVVKLEPIRFQGVIPKQIQFTELAATIPIRLGVDFTKIPKMPKTVTDILKEITTDDFEFAVTAPPRVAFTIENGIRIQLATQADPLRLSAFGIVEPSSLTLGARMRNKLDLKYVALGNASIQLEFDSVLMPAAVALGIPFTGIAMNGEVDLGTTPENRVPLKMAGGLRVTSNNIPDVIFDAEARNIKFSNLVTLYNMVAKKAGITGQIPLDKMPTINIDRVKGYMALEDVKIGRNIYEAGFKLGFDAQLFDRMIGLDFDLRHKRMTCSGSGYTSKIEVKSQNKVVFALSGAGPDQAYDTADDGPYIYYYLDAKNIPMSTFGIKTRLDIPPIGLQQVVDLEYSFGSFNGNFESTYAGFTAVFAARVNPAAIKSSMIKFGFKGDFGKFLSEQAIPGLGKLKETADDRLSKLDQNILQMSQEIGLLRSNAVKEVDKEIVKTRTTIRTIEQKIAALQKECAAATGFDKVLVCSRVNFELKAQGLALVMQKAYLEGMLKPGKEIVKSGKSLEFLTKEIVNAKASRKAVGTLIDGISKALQGITKGVEIFQITKAIGEFSITDLAQGRMPNLIALEGVLRIPDMDPIKISLSNVQFDFKNPKQAGLRIVQQVLEGIKVVE